MLGACPSYQTGPQPWHTVGTRYQLLREGQREQTHPLPAMFASSHLGTQHVPHPHAHHSSAPSSLEHLAKNPPQAGKNHHLFLWKFRGVLFISCLPSLVPFLVYKVAQQLISAPELICPSGRRELTSEFYGSDDSFPPPGCHFPVPTVPFTAFHRNIILLGRRGKNMKRIFLQLSGLASKSKPCPFIDFLLAQPKQKRIFQEAKLSLASAQRAVTY